MVYNTAERRFTVVNKDQIDWLGKREAPPNEPLCGFTGDRCDTRGEIKTTEGREDRNSS